MPRVFDGASVTILSPLSLAIQDAMKGNSNDILLNLTTNSMDLYLKQANDLQYGSVTYDKLTCSNASADTNLLDFVFSFVPVSAKHADSDFSDGTPVYVCFRNAEKTETLLLTIVLSKNNWITLSNNAGKLCYFEVRIQI